MTRECGRVQIFLPESPRWLMLAGKTEQAKAAIKWARGKGAKDPNILEAEFEEIEMLTTDLGMEKGLPE